MVNLASLVTVLLSGVLICAGQQSPEPSTFLREQIGLSDDQLAEISGGKVVAKVLPSKTQAEIIVFGAVFVRATPESYVRLAFDIDKLRRLPGYLGAGRIHDPPALADLDGFELEPDDIKSLRACRPGRCAVQLPAQSIRELQAEIDWSKPDASMQLNNRVRRMALNILQGYQERGNGVLGNYHDTDSPFDVNAELQSLMTRSGALPVYLPELRRYLLDYPKTTLTNVESLFYWEKVNFGMKPTLRLNHAISYRSEGPRGGARIVVVKQLFASHYFQLALDLSACVAGSGRPGSEGFYLISVRGSKQQGFTGLFGSLLRRIVVSRTRSAQEKALINVKLTLEAKPGEP